MSVRVQRLPSKIVQVSGIESESEYIAYVVCEDGSMWVYNHHDGDYRSIHLPHEPPTQARKAELQRDAAVSARREVGVNERQQEIISAERLAEMREAVLKYGPANCWTGTTGTLAAMVFELLRAIGEERGT